MSALTDPARPYRAHDGSASTRSPRPGASAMVGEMAQGKAADPVTLLAEFRERARVLDQRVAALGRHL